MPIYRGFVLQPTYRIESGQPVVTLYGKLDNGRSFLVRDTQQVPHFHIREEDAGRARALGAKVVAAERSKVDLEGNPVIRVEVSRPEDTPPLRDRLSRAGIPCHEADIRFAYRYLIDRGIRASVEIRGAPRLGNGVDDVFLNPQIVPCDWTPELSVLSFDIETDPNARRLLSVSLYGCGASEVLIYTPPGTQNPEGAIECRSEKELLESFIQRVKELDPDILTGWNVVEFDLSVLLRIAGNHGTPLSIGRGPEPLRMRTTNFRGATKHATVQGRVVLDGIELLRGAFVRLESYSLDNAAREILGKGKTITGDHRAEDIFKAFREDRERFIQYNLNDSQLVLEILDKLRLVELTVERSRLTGMPPDRVAASIASFDFLYLSELSRRDIVAPTVAQPVSSDVQTTGGHVLDPLPGLYRNVLIFDFKSLYPNIIRTFQIDPLGLTSDASEEDAIVAPNGAAFKRVPGILPQLLDELFPRREAAKRAGDLVASQAIKILMNSFYGVLGTPACRFASPKLANAITGFGREILLWSKGRIEDYGYSVLYGDTDSLFVESSLEDPDAAHALGSRLVAELNRDLSDYILQNWRVRSRLELEFEVLYRRLFLPAIRHGTAGARKRYAGLVQNQQVPEVVFTGMEFVRSDWTELAKRVQHELYLRLFSDRPVDSYLRQAVSELRAGAFDELLVYRKSLRKNLSAYTASTPPHVTAARKMTSKPGSVITYVITKKGPEPANEQRSALDYEHYVQKQVRAVAEPVLTLLELSFDEVVGDDNQLKLF